MPLDLDSDRPRCVQTLIVATLLMTRFFSTASRPRVGNENLIASTLWSKTLGLNLILLLVAYNFPTEQVLGQDLTQWSSTTVLGNGGEALLPPASSATASQIAQPFGVEVGPDGDLYVTEVGHHRIWRLDLKTNQAEIVAGNGRAGYSGDGGPATKASLNEPYEIRFSREGDIYFVEMQNHLIRKIDHKTGLISTVAGTGESGFSGDGGPAIRATMHRPHSLVLDERRNKIYVADIGNHRVRSIDLSQGTIETLAGNGEKILPKDGQNSRRLPLLGPRALAIQEDQLWIALREGHSLWRLDLNTETLHHATGDGRKGFEQGPISAAKAHFNGPKGIALTPDGNIVIVDTENHAIRLYSPTQSLVTTISGGGPKQRGYQESSSPQTLSKMNRPHGIAVDSQGRVFVGDTVNHRVRQLTPPKFDR